jgi:hypothetical protein
MYAHYPFTTDHALIGPGRPEMKRSNLRRRQRSGATSPFMILWWARENKLEGKRLTRANENFN